MDGDKPESTPDGDGPESIPDGVKVEHGPDDWVRNRELATGRFVPSGRKRRGPGKSDGWLERYVNSFFELSGFDTERNKRIAVGGDGNVHEIGVYAESKLANGPILIECRDTDKFDKGAVDAFVAKLNDIDHSGAVLVVLAPDSEAAKKYRYFCERSGITFFDGAGLDKLMDEVEEWPGIPERHRHILDRLGVRRRQAGEARSIWDTVRSLTSPALVGKAMKVATLLMFVVLLLLAASVLLPSLSLPALNLPLDFYPEAPEPVPDNPSAMPVLSTGQCAIADIDAFVLVPGAETGQEGFTARVDAPQSAVAEGQVFTRVPNDSNITSVICRKGVKATEDPSHWYCTTRDTPLFILDVPQEVDAQGSVIREPEVYWMNVELEYDAGSRVVGYSCHPIKQGCSWSDSQVERERCMKK